MLKFKFDLQLFAEDNSFEIPGIDPEIAKQIAEEYNEGNEKDEDVDDAADGSADADSDNKPVATGSDDTAIDTTDDEQQADGAEDFDDTPENKIDAAAPEPTASDALFEQSSEAGEPVADLPAEPMSEELPVPELPVEPEIAVPADNTADVGNTITDSAGVEPVEETEETPAAEPVLSGDDWGFTSSPQEKAEEPAVEINESDSDDWGFGTTEASSGSNDNEEGQDWEWVYVEDNDDAGYPVMEAIGDNSYICSGDLYEQPKIADNNPIIYSSAPLDISSSPVIMDNAVEEEAVDPYQNSILKD